MVRMGELAVSKDPGHVLASIGLGSCIGLALVDRVGGVAGLAHVVLPSSDGTRADAAGAKYADVAVPALLDALRRAGSPARVLEAVLVGGAQMFSFGKAAGALEIGSRNEAAVRDQLQRVGIAVRATATGGTTGRTIRVVVGSGEVTVREAGGRDVPLFPRAAAMAVAAR